MFTSDLDQRLRGLPRSAAARAAVAQDRTQ
jgi:hypothetical protein